METKELFIESKPCDKGTILVENGSTLASSSYKCDFIKERVDSFLLSAIPSGKSNVKVEIKVTIL